MRIFFLLWIAISVIACDQKSQSMDSVQLQRMQQLRQKLKTKLGENYNLPIDPATEEQLKRGRQLYPQVCGSCHGGRGDGGGKVSDGLTIQPPSFTDSTQATFLSDQARLWRNSNSERLTTFAKNFAISALQISSCSKVSTKRFC